MNFVAVSQECAPWVAHETMAAIAKTESEFRPLTIGVNGGAKLVRQPENKAEAVATANWLIAHGYNIDLGIGQVNSANLAKTGLTIEDAFDPCKNLAAAATILYKDFQAAKRKGLPEQAALHAALSAYNTGTFTRGFSNGYVLKVVNNARALPVTPEPAPTPLVGAQAAKPAIKLHVEPINQAVKLKAEKQPIQNDGINVYDGQASQSVMVY